MVSAHLSGFQLANQIQGRGCQKKGSKCTPVDTYKPVNCHMHWENHNFDVSIATIFWFVVTSAHTSKWALGLNSCHIFLSLRSIPLPGCCRDRDTESQTSFPHSLVPVSMCMWEEPGYEATSTHAMQYIPLHMREDRPAAHCHNQDQQMTASGTTLVPPSLPPTGSVR